MEGIGGTPKTLRRYYKMGEAISKNHSAIRNESKKIIWKTSLNFKEGEKRENTVRDSETCTRGYTWIQTSQVLEAYKELPKSETFELILTLWHIPVEKGPNVLKAQK